MHANKNFYLHLFIQCQARCGSQGFRTRILKCVWHGSGLPAGHACATLTRPVVKESCNGTPCTNSNNLIATNSTIAAATTTSREHLHHKFDDYDDLFNTVEDNSLFSLFPKLKYKLRSPRFRKVLIKEFLLYLASKHNQLNSTFSSNSEEDIVKVE